MKIPYVFTKFIKLARAWLDERRPLVFEKTRFVFHEKQKTLHVQAISVQNVCDAGIVSQKITTERCFQYEKVSIETMTEEMEKLI